MDKQLELINELEVELVQFLQPFKEKHKDQLFDFWVVKKSNSFEIYGKHKDEFKESELSDLIMLRMDIYPEWEQIHLENIFIPHFMIHNGIGKKMIAKVFEVAEKYGYELYLVLMVKDFYKRMIKRGAWPCNEKNDAVRIVKETQLV